MADLRLVLAESSGPDRRVDWTYQVQLFVAAPSGPELAFQRSAFHYFPMETPLALGRLDGKHRAPKITLAANILDKRSALDQKIEEERMQKKILSAVTP